MKIIIAIDSFKGCLRSTEAGMAAAKGIKDAIKDADIQILTVSDGGEGYREAFCDAVDGNSIEVPTRDPLMRPITAQYMLKDKLAVIEMAEASGLTLLSEKERNPMRTTSYGTGLLIADAVKRGAKHIIIGLGGSATSDAGMGMLKALIDTFAPHGNWNSIEELDDVKFTIASDVKNPLCGKYGAAAVFGPQKGATPEMVKLLDERARKFAEISAFHFGYDKQNEEGAGAAGGLGYALMQYLHADCKPGIELLLETLRFDELTQDADLVITGEGAADRQTLMGKLPIGILHHAGQAKVWLIAGKISDHQELLQAGFNQVACINPPGIILEEAMKPKIATKNIRNTVREMIKTKFLTDEDIASKPRE